MNKIYLGFLLLSLCVLSSCHLREHEPMDYLPDKAVFKFSDPDLRDKIIVDMLNDSLGAIYRNVGTKLEVTTDIGGGPTTGRILEQRLQEFEQLQMFLHYDDFYDYNFRTIGSGKAVALDATWEELKDLRFYASKHSTGLFLARDGKPAHIISKKPFTEIKVFSHTKTGDYKKLYGEDWIDVLLQKGEGRSVSHFNCFNGYPLKYKHEAQKEGHLHTLLIYIEPEK